MSKLRFCFISFVAPSRSVLQISWLLPSLPKSKSPQLNPKQVQFGPLQYNFLHTGTFLYHFLHILVFELPVYPRHFDHFLSPFTVTTVSIIQIYNATTFFLIYQIYLKCSTPREVKQHAIYGTRLQDLLNKPAITRAIA